jgi:hypothetical protein
MRVFTKTVKVLGVTHSELDGLIRLITDARSNKKAEIQIGPTQYLTIEVDDKYAYLERERDVRR